MTLIPFVYMIKVGILGAAIMPADASAVTGWIAGVSVQTVTTLCKRCCYPNCCKRQVRFSFNF
jgi:hypothetical protein